MQNLFKIISITGILVILIVFLNCANSKSDRWIKKESNVVEASPLEVPKVMAEPAPKVEAVPTPETKAPVSQAVAQAPAPTQPAAPAPPAQAPAPEAEKSKPTKGKVSPILDPKDPRSILYLDTSGKLAGTGDPTKSGIPSEAYRAGQAWHSKTLAAEVLPKDKYGLVDWAKAAKDNLIAPRHSLDQAEEDIVLDMDVVIPAKSDFMNDVVYPHFIHTWWLKCEVCHMDIFMMQAGGNEMYMTEIVEGKWCGRCHGKIAFPLTDCNRCHTKPKETTGGKTK